MASDPPPWVHRDHTGDLLRELRTATLEEVPTGCSADPATLRLLTIFAEADLSFQAQVVYYDKYVPTVVVIPGPRRPGAPTLPQAMRVLLSDADRQQAHRLQNTMSITPAGRPPTEAFGHSAVDVNWELAKIIAGRIDAYKRVIEDSADVAKLSASLSVSFVSTLLNVASLALTVQGVDSPTAHMLVSCPAFILGAATTSLSAPLGIGVIGLISTLESYADCMQNMLKFSTQIKKTLADQSLARQLAETLARGSHSNHFSREGDRMDFFDGWNKTDSVKTSDITKHDIEVRSADDGRFRAWIERFERPAPDGGVERCMRAGFENDRGSFEVEHCVNEGTGETRDVLP